MKGIVPISSRRQLPATHRPAPSLESTDWDRLPCVDVRAAFRKPIGNLPTSSAPETAWNECLRAVTLGPAATGNSTTTARIVCPRLSRPWSIGRKPGGRGATRGAGQPSEETETRAGSRGGQVRYPRELERKTDSYHLGSQQFTRAVEHLYSQTRLGTIGHDYNHSWSLLPWRPSRMSRFINGRVSNLRKCGASRVKNTSVDLQSAPARWMPSPHTGTARGGAIGDPADAPCGSVSFDGKSDRY